MAGPPRHNQPATPFVAAVNAPDASRNKIWKALDHVGHAAALQDRKLVVLDAGEKNPRSPAAVWCVTMAKATSPEAIEYRGAPRQFEHPSRRAMRRGSRIDCQRHERDDARLLSMERTLQDMQRRLAHVETDVSYLRERFPPIGGRPASFRYGCD